MSEPFVLPLEACEDPTLVGGKAAGLGRLLRRGFRVPPGFCLTTAVYREALRELGIDPDVQWEQVKVAESSTRDELLKECRRRIETFPIAQVMLWIVEPKQLQLENVLKRASETLWAVRSSASQEDASAATFAGVYRTKLGVSRPLVASAIVECWASLWTPAAWAYHARSASRQTAPAMAVILQPMLSPLAAGVAYSCNPLTGRSDVVAINSVFGLAEPLVSGQVTPDYFVVEAGIHSRRAIVVERHIAEKTTARVVTPTGMIDQPLASGDQHEPSLKDRHLIVLARLAKRVERAFGRPVDIEWALDRHRIWLLQARPISTASSHSLPLSPASCVWSRANFKETLPDLPSPLGLSFLERFMEVNIIDHYRQLGCYVSPDLASLRIIRGRPYINVTLLQSCMLQLGGDPALVLEQMGGQANPVLAGPPRLAWWKLLRAVLLMEWKIRRAVRRAPAWFAEMKQMGEVHTSNSIAGLAPVDLFTRMDKLSKRLFECDITFAIAGGVSQGFQVLNWLLERRVRPGWKPLLNTALQGLGNVISAKQILWLTELAEQANQEPIARDFLLAEPWDPKPFRANLAGTSFLHGLEEYLIEYGHRALGESDLMSPRFAEIPDYVLGVIRGHLLGPSVHSAGAVRREQELGRQEALQRIRAVFGGRWHERAFFNWWYRRLCLFLALREANRHYMMHFSGVVRRLALIVGERLAAADVLQSKDDIFYLTADEMRIAINDHVHDWKSLVAERRVERAQNATGPGPDMVIGVESSASVMEPARGDVAWKGIPVSAGYAEGPVRLVRTPEEVRQVHRGDILVTPVIDPGMAPVLGLASGLVVEMGGILSHGVIIAREYGIPAVVNVHGITHLLKDGERVAVDAQSGEVRRIGTPSIRRDDNSDG